MAGRPTNENRALAVLMGDKTYVGAMHARCQTDVRYVKGGGCVHCARIIATDQREALKFQKASAAGAIDKAQEDGLDTRSAAEKFRQSIEDDLM